MAEHEPATPLQKQMSEMYDDIRREPTADSMDFMVTRPPEKQREGTTFSAAALDELGAAIQTFIHARVGYHWEAKDGGMKALGPSVIKAEVRLTIDGVHVTPDDDHRPWYVIDGQQRPH